MFEVQHPPQVLSLRVDALKPHPKEARRQRRPNQIRRIAENIETFGILVPVVVNEKGTILLGYRRFLAAKSLGMECVPAVRVKHLTLVQRIAFLIAERDSKETVAWDYDARS